MTTTPLKETKEFLESKLNGFRPEIGMIVGSGLSGVTAAVENPVKIPYAEVPNFPRSTVTGHAGELIFGTLAEKKLMVMSGRFHFYEGHSMQTITYPIRVMDTLGVKILIVTNAAGGINPNYKAGQLMLIDDHINFMGTNPLIGNENGAPRFIDMTMAYSNRLLAKMEAAAEKLQIEVRRGIYLATTGPSYETPAEIKAFAWLGADAVGMSTVPEVIVARANNIEVVGISCITNLAAGITGRKLSHEEVLETGKAVQENLSKLLKEFIASL
jgi:purine-nucleoside phosphorylase